MAAEAAAPLRRLAHAKVNLSLHLRGRRPDGYHLLDSLVVFPEVGDLIEVRPADGLSLSIGGPFAAGLSAGPENLVLRAAEGLARATAVGTGAGAAIRLVKNLPVASGVGGGSSDAAATLDLLSQLWSVPVPDALALSLGADVPVCRAAPRPMRMRGIGEILDPAPPMPNFWLLLVNPSEAVSTGAVFAALRDRNTPAPPAPPRRGFDDFDAFARWLATQRNDLESTAAGLCPAIGEVLRALGDAPVARMSGSGATCFAMLGTESQARALAGTLHGTGWWVATAPVKRTEAAAAAELPLVRGS